MSTALLVIPTPLSLDPVLLDRQTSDETVSSDADSISPGSKTHALSVGSPSSVSEVPEVPKRRLRRKRARMSDDERRVRHREVQREFMKRKRARIAALRQVESGVEKKLRYVRLLHEIQNLKTENIALEEQLERMDRGEHFVFYVPSEHSHDDFALGDVEWNEIYAVLSDGPEDSELSIVC